MGNRKEVRVTILGDFQRPVAFHELSEKLDMPFVEIPNIVAITIADAIYIDQDTPRVVLQFPVGFARVSFPEAGEYRVQFVVDGDVLVERRLMEGD